MNVVVEIAGREALPVWTIPYVTSWDIGADELLNRLVAPNYNNEPTFPTAFSLDRGKPCPVPSIHWIDTQTMIGLVMEDLDNKTLSDDEKLREFKERSLEIIMQQEGCYIWLNEFKTWLECSNENTTLFRRSDNDKRFIEYRIEPYLNPSLPSKYELHFENELKKLNFKAVCNPTSAYTSVYIDDLLEFSIVDLLEKYKFVDEEAKSDGVPEKSFNLSEWKKALDDEKVRVCAANYDNEAKREYELKNINDKLKEIEQCLADYLMESDNESPMPDYGEPELLPSDAINLYPALKLLGDDWTVEEFAIQVIHGSIRAFEKSNNGAEKLRPFTNEADAILMDHYKTEFFPFESDSIEEALLEFKYSKPELLKFKPECRYISFNNACELVAKSTGDIKKAEVYLKGKLKRGVIYAIHPTGWFPPSHSLNGERWRSGYFNKSKLEQLIADDFEGIPNEDEQPEKTGNDSAVSNKYDDYKTSLDKLKDTGINLKVLTVKNIYTQVQQTDKNLWNIKLGTFRRNVWSRYSAENDLKKKGGRPSSK